MKSIEILNKHKTCRTCLKLHSSTNELISIFETEKFVFPHDSNNVQFSEMLSNVSNHLCSVDDYLPKSICFACMNSVRSAYCFKLQSETSYNTLIEQFGSGCTNIKIEYCSNIPDHQVELEETEQIGIDTELVPELTNISLPPKIIDDIDIKLEPEEEDFLVEVTNIPITEVENDYNEAYSCTYDDENDFLNEYQPDSEMESISDSKDNEKNINDDKQSASGTSATDSGTCTNTEEPDLYTDHELVKLKCQVCSKQLYSVGSLKRHKKSHADTNCNFCRRKYSGKPTLKYHVKCKHPEKYAQFLLNGQTKAIVKMPLLNIPKCCSCIKTFCSMEALYKHHASCDLKCIECNSVIWSKNLYFKHLGKEHGIDLMIHALECPFCKKKFLSERRLNDHITRSHPENENTNAATDVCKNILSTESTSNIIVPSLSLGEPLIKNIELTKDEFVAKYVKVFQGNFMNCSLCEVKFKLTNLMSHLVIRHAVVKPFKCPFCPIRCQSSEIRLRHLYHDHPDGYKCENCNTIYEYGNTYLQHMLDVHGVVVKLPTNEEEPDIENHNLKFSSNAMENLATKTQFIERYMKNLSIDTTLCVPCQKPMSKKGVNFHISRYHATEMAYKCPCCIRRFIRMEYRSKHMKKAHPTVYYCTLCNVQFQQHKIFTEHMKTTHNITITTEPEPGEQDDIPFNDLLFMAVLTTENKNYHESDFQNPTKSKKNTMKFIKTQDNIDLSNIQKPLKKNEFVELYLVRNDKIVSCKVCCSSFSCLKIGVHLKRWHATTKPFVCQICDADFYRNDARTKHMCKLHPNELKCNFCNIQFNKALLYVDHMRVTHRITVELPVNTKTAPVDLHDLLYVGHPNRISTKLQHKWTSFEKIQVLKAQSSSTNKDPVGKDEFIRMYTKKTQKPDKIFCIPCNIRITRKNMTEHLKTKHSTMKTYKCALCKCDFLYQKSRTSHMRIVHSDDYRCLQCNVQFITSSLYAKHMKENHNEIVPLSIEFNEVIDVPSDKLLFVQDNTSIIKQQHNSKVLVNGEKTVAPKALAPKVLAPKVLAPKVLAPETSLNCLQKCSDCNEEFESSRSYRLHMRVHHIKTEDVPVEIKIEPEAEISLMKIKQEPKKFHTCDICQKSFVAVISLNAHKKFRHNIEPKVDIDDDDIMIVAETLPKSSSRKKVVQYECEVCDVVLFRTDYLQNHIKAVHPGEYICQFCNRVNHNYVDMIHHVNTVHCGTITDDNLFDCKKCYAKFSVEDHLKLHMLEKHVKEPLVSKYYCVPCKIIYPNSITLERHKLRVTHVQKSATVEHLNSNNRIDLKKVIRQRRNSIENQNRNHLQYFITKGRHLICQICKSVFINRKRLLKHLKTHKEIPTLDCPICPLQFFMKKSYDSHLQAHDVCVKDNCRLSCKICRNWFSNKKNLMMHINVCYDSKDNINFKCGFCGTLHENNDELIKHFKTHTENDKAQVVIEKETEEHQSDNDSPYCKICNQSFKFKIIQNIHNNMWHNASNPNRNLNREEQQRLKKENETNIIKFIKCKLCDEVFIKPDDLDEHLKTTHSSTSDNDKSNDESMLIIDEAFLNNSKTEFNCDKCILNFPCQQYLTNHQMYFCKSSPKVVINISENENTLNEQ